MQLRNYFLSLISLVVLGMTAACGSNPTEFVRPTNSDAIVGECDPSIPESGADATQTAQALIDLVGEANIAFEIDAVQRYTWSVLPVPIVERPDQGARRGDLSEEAKALVCDLVDATLSDSGVALVYG